MTLTRAEYLTAHEILDEGETVEKVHEVAENAQQFLDGQIDTAARLAQVQPACPKEGGCTYCCYQAVVCSVPEVIQIADHLRQTKTSVEIEAVKERCRTWTTNTAGLNELNVIHQACPLLERDQGGHGGACSVYPHRPMPCRGYHSMDLAACQRLYEHPEDKTFMIPTFGLTFAAEVSLGLDEALRERGLQSRVVLAPALLSALEDPDAASKWLAGDRRAFGEQAAAFVDSTTKLTP